MASYFGLWGSGPCSTCCGGQGQDLPEPLGSVTHTVHSELMNADAAEHAAQESHYCQEVVVLKEVAADHGDDTKVEPKVADVHMNGGLNDTTDTGQDGHSQEDEGGEEEVVDCWRKSRRRHNTHPRLSVLEVLQEAKNSTSQDLEQAPGDPMLLRKGRTYEIFHSDLVVKAIIGGSQILLVAVVLSVIGRAAWLGIRATSDCNLWPSSLTAEQRPVATGLEGFVGCLTITFLVASYLRPRSMTYYAGLVLLLAYSFMLVIPPLGLSCRDLIRTARCQKFDVVHMDCTLQGSPHMTSSMMVIFLGPFIIPHGRMMLLLYGLHMCAYIGYTVWHKAKHEEDFFDEVDAIIGFVLLLLTSIVAVLVKRRTDRRKQETYNLNLRNKELSKTMLSLFKYLVPEHVVVPMIQGLLVAKRINEASVLFIEICNFATYTESFNPAEVLNFLNDIFSSFDSIMHHFGVMKVETIGEEYVACVGVVPEDRKRRKHSAALHDLIRAAIGIFSLHQEPEGEVTLRMGLHTGKVVAGVIGQKLPRFRLFGDTMNMAARMMHHGKDGELQFSDATESYLLQLPDPDAVARTCRGKTEIKGKGRVTTYFLNWRSQAATCREELEALLDDEDPMAVRCQGRKPTENSRISSSWTPSLMQLMPSMTSARSVSSTNSEAKVPMTPADSPTSRKSISSFGLNSRLGNKGGKSVSKDLQMVVYSTMSTQVRRHRLFCPFTKATTWRTSQSMPEGFVDKWREAHFKAKIYDPARRLSLLQAAVVLGISVVEALVAVALDGDTSSLPRFCIARAVIVLLLLVAFCACRVAAIASRVQLFCIVRLFLMCGTLVALLVSYTALAMDFDNLDLDLSVQELQDSVDERPYRIQIWSHMFILLYLAGSVTLRLPLLHTIFFVVFAMATVVLNATLWDGRIIFAPHQITMFVIMNLVYLTLVRNAEHRSMGDYKSIEALADARQRIESLLTSLLPPLVASQLLTGDGDAHLTSHRYEDAALLQSDLVGFTELASFRLPEEVVQIISELFGLFDDLTDKHHVCKIETVGDAYIAAQASAPLSAVYRPELMVKFALEMVVATHSWAQRFDEKINLRVGLHHGVCLGGIVGTDMLRYHLFGDLLKELGSLESTAPPGRVHVSKAFRIALERQFSREGRDASEVLFQLEERPNEPLETSKGRPVPAEDVGGVPTFLAKLPQEGWVFC